MKLEFDKNRASFILYEQSTERIIFDDLIVKLRLTALSLKGGRIKPLAVKKDGGDYEFPLIQHLIGESAIYGIDKCSGSLSIQNVLESLLITYKSESYEAFSPDEAVTLAASEMPNVEGAVFYHNRSDDFRNFDCEGLWWSQAIFAKNPAKDIHNDWGMLAIWKYCDGRVCAMLPMTTENILGRLRGGCGATLSVISATTTTGEQTKEYPLALISLADTVDDAVDNVYRSYATLNLNLPRRTSDSIGAPFDKLGWCTWNAFGQQCSENAILEAVNTFSSKQVPIKYFIIDDCWQDTIKVNDTAKLSEGITDSVLAGLCASGEKFPSGIGKLVQKCKQMGIESVGLWHAMNGYWQGIWRESSVFKENPQWFIESAKGKIFPKPGSEFFSVWYNLMRQWGIDFVKIDNGGFHRRNLSYEQSLCRYMSQLQQDIKSAATSNDLRIIYCMATHPENVYNSLDNQILRITNDFIPNDAYGTRKHIVNNFFNSVWLDKLQWPDFDMFQSSDINAEAFAHSLAISQSPIYITDKPENVRPELLKRLVLEDGSIPRYRKTVRPLESRFFDNPYADDNVLAVSASCGEIVTVALFNVVSSSKAVSGQIKLKELGLDSGCYLAYSDSGYFEPQLVGIEGCVNFCLNNLKSDMITLAPVIDGFAIIGVIDYYAAPACIRHYAKNANGWEIQLKTHGKVLAYLEQAPSAVRNGDQAFKRVQSNPDNCQYCWQNGILTINSIATEFNIEI